MKVCRIEKNTVLRKVGEVITASKREHNYSEGRAKAESMLEDVRKQDHPDSYGRGNSLFVFPYDDKKEERAFQWASTYAPTPGSSCQVYLLELDVDKVERHDSRCYENLYFLLNGKKYGMSDRTSADELLCSNYWRGMSDISEIATEGLIEGVQNNFIYCNL